MKKTCNGQYIKKQDNLQWKKRIKKKTSPNNWGQNHGGHEGLQI